VELRLGGGDGDFEWIWEFVGFLRRLETSDAHHPVTLHLFDEGGGLGPLNSSCEHGMTLRQPQNLMTFLDNLDID
jgi:hypothetical protein